MKVDFFSPVYQREQSRNDAIFGINDGVQQNGEEGIAYSTTDEAEKPWNAVVNNAECHDVLFTPLDHNINIHPVSSETYSLCDGMLSHGKEWLAFVELKVHNAALITAQYGATLIRVAITRRSMGISSGIERSGATRFSHGLRHADPAEEAL